MTHNLYYFSMCCVYSYAAILPADTFEKILRDSLSEDDSRGWLPEYMARYTVMIKARGVLHAKGYIVKAVRQPCENNEEL